MSFYHLAFFAKGCANVIILRIKNKLEVLPSVFHYVMNQNLFIVHIIDY